MEKEYATKILGIPILLLCVLASGQISMAQAEDLCGNTLCEATESCITCASDCSCGDDFEWNCADTVDNDLDERTDCNDADCTGELACIRVSNIEVIPVKRISPQAGELSSKSAAPEEGGNSVTQPAQISARTSLWISLGALAIVSSLLLYRRMRLLSLEDLDEW